MVRPNLVRPVCPEDAAEVSGIYNYYIKNTVVTFEEEPLDPSEMKRRIGAVTAKYPWFVCEENGGVLGYAYLNAYRERSAYRFAAELSVYIRQDRQGEGIGTELLARLLEAARETEIHAIVSAVTLPNERSVALQEKFGFTGIARFREIGFKHGRRLDVGYWELVIN
ncbi:MAG: GNAT family N-acetyltransferase [Treponema sp.]|jgi:phosphinothricin acetyltransferase|nr:GNAT family N-acetyltransferase [Treponema sp.]